MTEIKELKDEQLEKASGGFYPGRAITSMAGVEVEFTYTDTNTGEYICGRGILTGNVEERCSSDDEPEYDEYGIRLPKIYKPDVVYEDYAELVDGRWVPCRYLDAATPE